MRACVSVHDRACMQMRECKRAFAAALLSCQYFLKQKYLFLFDNMPQHCCHACFLKCNQMQRGGMEKKKEVGRRGSEGGTLKDGKERR